MINWLIGPSGGGKSYEAVRYHVLPALEKGRHVITNLPLIVEEFEKLDPEFGKYLHLRKAPQPIRGVFHIVNETPEFDLFSDGKNEEPPRGKRVFAGVWDFYFTDDYRTAKGQGPLFIIDECHFSFPHKETDRAVEDWFSVHRHYNCDVLLVTQSYGKVSQAIRDNSQIVYRCRKNVAFGSQKTYTRKVQDGLRGEVVNTAIRSYDPKYFPLYKSHTQGESVEEFGAEDIVPFWKRWPFIGMGICAVIFLFLLPSLKNPLNANNYTKTPPAQKVQRHPVAPPTPKKVDFVQAKEGGEGGTPLAGGSFPDAPPADPEPQDLLDGRGLHIMAHLKSATKEIWKFGLSQNGQAVTVVDLTDLQAAGYTWKPYGECLGFLIGNGTRRAIACDAPTVGATVGGVKPIPESTPAASPPSGSI